MEVNFGKVITAMVTPFNELNEVDEQKVIWLVNHLIRTGSDGIVVAGTTGEGPTLSKKEKMNLFELVKTVAGERASVIANVGNNNTAETVEFAQLVERETNVDGLLVVNPYYNKPNQRGLYAHFKTVAESVKLPIMLYNIPGRTSVNLNAETTIELSKISNIVAVKESSGNLDQMSRIIENTDEDFKVYSGDDNLTLPVIAIGGYGVVSVASHLYGYEIKQMIEEKDANIHRKLLDLFNVLFIDTNPLGIKYLLNRFNDEFREDVRLPLVPMEEEIKEKIWNTHKITVKNINKLEVKK